MIGRRKKQPPVQRAPHLNQQKQTTFRYSSNRSQSDRVLARHDPNYTEKDNGGRNMLLRRFKQAPFIIGAFTAVAVAVYFSLLLAPPKIVIKDDAGPIRANAPYASFVSSITDNIGSRTKLSINRQEITEKLQARFPELENIEISTPLFANRAVIETKIARPEVLLKNGTDSFLLNNRGVALLNTTKEQTSLKTDKIVTVTDQSSLQAEIGKQALTSNQVAFIREINWQAQAKKLGIDTITIKARGGELEVRHTGVPYMVKYNLNEDARKSFGTFYSTKEYIEEKNISPAEYMDVRIPERAYIK